MFTITLITLAALAAVGSHLVWRSESWPLLTRAFGLSFLSLYLIIVRLGLTFGPAPEVFGRRLPLLVAIVAAALPPTALYFSALRAREATDLGHTSAGR